MFYCISCDEEEQGPSVNIADHECCEASFKDTIVPQFEQALKYEISYPVKVDEVGLNIVEFQRFFNQEFLDAFPHKEKEYTTPVSTRLYCQHQVFEAPSDGSHKLEHCNAFLGRRSEFQSTIACQCGGMTCTKCSEAVQENQQHECKAINPKDDQFQDMGQGVDWQRCPKTACGMKFQLLDGCNAVKRSFCSTDLCFICGEEAKDYSGHWDLGNPCPRFGKKGSSRAIYDDPVLQDERADLAPILDELREHALLFASREGRVTLTSQAALDTSLGLIVGEARNIRNQTTHDLASFLGDNLAALVHHLWTA